MKKEIVTELGPFKVDESRMNSTDVGTKDDALFLSVTDDNERKTEDGYLHSNMAHVVAELLNGYEVILSALKNHGTKAALSVLDKLEKA